MSYDFAFNYERLSGELPQIINGILVILLLIMADLQDHMISHEIMMIYFCP